MGQQKGGKKLRRTSKHKSKYAAQFLRTERNKAMARARIARRKANNPSPITIQRDTNQTGSTQT